MLKKVFVGLSFFVGSQSIAMDPQYCYLTHLPNEVQNRIGRYLIKWEFEQEFINRTKKLHDNPDTMMPFDLEETINFGLLTIKYGKNGITVVRNRKPNASQSPFTQIYSSEITREESFSKTIQSDMTRLSFPQFNTQKTAIIMHGQKEHNFARNAPVAPAHVIISLIDYSSKYMQDNLLSNYFVLKAVCKPSDN